MSDKNTDTTTTNTNPMKETNPPAMPTIERRDGGEKEIKRR